MPDPSPSTTAPAAPKTTVEALDDSSRCSDAAASASASASGFEIGFVDSGGKLAISVLNSQALPLHESGARTRHVWFERCSNSLPKGL